MVTYDVDHPPVFDDRQREVAARGAELFRRYGSLVVEHALEPDLVRTLHADFIEHYASKSAEEIEESSTFVGDQRWMFTIDLKPPWTTPALYAAARIMPVVRRLLGADCILMSVGAVCSFPTAQVQHVHLDHPSLFGERSRLGADLPPYALHVVIPLVDLDERTGTTAMWEGSHLLTSTPADQARWKTGGLEGAVLPWSKLGDCYLMDYRLRHAGTPNCSDHPRPILYLIYSRRWFLDRENYDGKTRLRITGEELDLVPDEHLRMFADALPEHPRRVVPTTVRHDLTREELMDRLTRLP